MSIATGYGGGPPEAVIYGLQRKHSIENPMCAKRNIFAIVELIMCVCAAGEIEFTDLSRKLIKVACDL